MPALLLTLALLLAPAQDPPSWRVDTLSRGTPFETPVWVIEGAAPGPTVVVVGGMHGDEAAGAEAARAVAHWSVGAGRLVVVPAANPPALAAGTRRIPGVAREAGDLNRHFPDEGEPASAAARELWGLVASHEPDWLVDLHEGFAVHRRNPESVGHSVISSPDERTRALARKLAAVADEELGDPEVAFTVLRGPVEGSLARRAWEAAGVRSFLLETCKAHGRLPQRARLHRLMVHALLVDLEMQPCPPSRLVDPERAGGKALVALYTGDGAFAASARRARHAIGDAAVWRHVDGRDVRNGALEPFDVVLHPGGSGSKQGRALGEAGRGAVRRFVADGGAYLGICAGAYLGANNYDWSLDLLAVDVIDRAHWKRGTGPVVVEATERGRAVLGAPAERFELHYANGPLFAPTRRPAAGPNGAAPYEAWLHYRSEKNVNGAPEGVMLDTPAVVAGELGRGRVLLCSPHPESTAGREGLLRAAVEWLLGE